MTVPPCTENVQWIVLQKPIAASEEQIMAIDRLHNVKLSRALTPTNRRPITHGWFHSSNIHSAISKNAINKPWFGINPANMVIPQVKPPKELPPMKQSVTPKILEQKLYSADNDKWA